jgi:deoxyribodipyrimidine photo-lyase
MPGRAEGFLDRGYVLAGASPGRHEHQAKRQRPLRLPLPPIERPAVVAWVASHLDSLFTGDPAASQTFTGGQTAADHALTSFDVSGYAGRRNEVWPPERRGASRLSPYIRHGLLGLPRVWEAVAAGPAGDVAKFRDELLWQEYARHLYARLGRANRSGLRRELRGARSVEAWPRDMECIRLNVDELEQDGWLVNQTRMWLASHWAIRRGADWRDGEERFFTHLLDGSRAANRAGWQWTVGTATGRPYGFSRRQVVRRAPGVCDRCDVRNRCPIEDWPPDPPLEHVQAALLLTSDPDPERTAGPVGAEIGAEPEAVWLTAESLGDGDPALRAHPEVPAVFVFDEPLLDRLQLSAKRLVFLAETLADLAHRRPLEIYRGDPAAELAGRNLAVTFAPVPGWHTRSRALAPVAIHPWPWLRRPHGGSVASFSAWRKML